MTYTNCRVPISNVIAGEGMGFRLAQERLGPGRVHHCMRWIGNAEKALDLMCKRAATREIEDGVMLGEKQFIQDFIAESRAEIDASRLYVLNTAYMIDTVGVSKVRDAVSAIKFYVANAFLRVLDRAIQVHGALGLRTIRSYRRCIGMSGVPESGMVPMKFTSKVWRSVS